jgi:hypothetical protein
MKRTEEIIAALRDIDSHIQPDDYVASGVISDAADRLEELQGVLQIIREDFAAVANRMITCTTFKFSVGEALRRLTK